MKILLLTLLLLTGCNPFPKSAQLRIIFSEDDSPLVDAVVRYSWSYHSDPSGKGGTTRSYSAKAHADKDGVANVSAANRLVFVNASMEGFYSSKYTLHFDQVGDRTVDIPMRRVIDPVGLFGKQAFLLVSGESGHVGYDLFKGDFVAPFGTGTHSDFNIVYSKPKRNHAQDRFEAYDFIVTNNGDGFFALHIPYSASEVPESEFRTLYKAPESGYKASLREAAKVTGKGARDRYVYYFRIRTVATGGAIYGKIVSGPSYTFHNDKNAFKFTYMINTSGDRNLEPDIQSSSSPRLGQLEYSLQSSTQLEYK